MTSKISNFSEYFERTNFVVHTLETISQILHTIAFDVNTTYLVWPHLLICMDCPAEESIVCSYQHAYI